MLLDKIRTLPGLVAAGLVAADGTLVDWCANSALDPRRLQQAAAACARALEAGAPLGFSSERGLAQLDERTLLFRAIPQGTLIALLQGQLDETSADWFWEQVDAWLRLY